MIKPEHGGAKHRKGYWGPKAVAKKKSRKARRALAKKEAAGL